MGMGAPADWPRLVQLGSAPCIIVKNFVKITHSEQQQSVRMIGLDA